MKTLNKIRLINWHYFTNETTDIEQITFLTGSNGSGKSTIIDALQIVLLGDTAGKNFNKAANEKGTGRTLKGYLRGETGVTNNGETMCLRKGRFTSYIVLQMFDDIKNRNNCLGIVFDFFPDESEEHHFFFLDDKMPENNFTNAGMVTGDKIIPLSYKDLLQFFQNNYKKEEFTFFESNASYQKFIKMYFGNLPDKYFSLLKKAVSFSPITNISQFITEFVCDVDHKVDITPMTSNIEQYKLLELEAGKIQKKVDSLEAIKNSYAIFKDIKNKLKLIDYVSKRSSYEVSLNQLKIHQQELLHAQNRIKEIDELLEEKSNLINDFSSKKELYMAQKVSDEKFSLSQSLIKEKKGCQEKIQEITEKLQVVSLAIKNYCEQYKKAASVVLEVLEKTDYSFLESEVTEKFDHYKDSSKDLLSIIDEVTSKMNSNNDFDYSLITDMKSEMTLFIEEGRELMLDMRNLIRKLDNQNIDAQNDLRTIKLGKKPFDRRFENIKNALETELRNRHDDAVVNVYCDLVDIVDKRWNKAIEGAIYSQKFNLFVDSKYYVEANDILKKIIKTYDYFPVSLIDSETIIDKGFQAKDGSLAEIITTTHEGARYYTNYILGGIRRCENFYEAKASGSGLLVDCTGYRHFGSWYINPNNYRESFIGTKVDEGTYFERNQEINKRRAMYDKVLYILNSFQSILRLESLNSNEVNTWQNDINSARSLPMLEDSINKINNELSEKSYDDITSIDNKLNSFTMDIKDMEDEKAKLFEEKGTLMQKINNLNNEKIPFAVRLVDERKADLLSFDEQFIVEVANPFYEKALETYAYADISQKAGSDFAKLSYKLRIATEELIKLRSKYISDNGLNYNCTNEENNDEFDKELEDLSQVQLPMYREKILLAHEKSIKEFKDDFIYKLRTSIETVKSQIEELNDALKDVKFGRDSYQFSVTPNNDYIDYYNMITDDLLLTVGDAEDVFLSKYGEIMDNLFKLISDSSENSDENQRAIILENIERFTDYRTYLLFDLLVKKDNGEVSSLARTFKRQSGGETQTPFYISILASFAQLYRLNQTSNSNCLRLVIFDEAFSKMDSARIQESVNLLRSFGLQAILSTPAEKLRDLAKYVDLVLVTIHDEKKRRSYLDKYKELVR